MRKVMKATYRSSKISRLFSGGRLLNGEWRRVLMMGVMVVDGLFVPLPVINLFPVGALLLRQIS